MPRFINPPNVREPSSSYSHGVLLAPHSKRLIISGQVGVRPDGTIAEGLEAQTEQVFDNLLAVVEAGGMKPTDIVKIVTYCVVPDQFHIVREVRTRKLGKHAPASTLLRVAGLANPDFLIEIEAEAVQEVPL